MAGPNYSAVGFAPKAVPVTPLEAVHRQSQSNVKAIVKGSMQRYLAKFFDEDGKYRYLTKSIFPSMLKFVTDLSFNEDSIESQADNKVAMPIFKFFNEVRSHVPCIVIADTGITWKSPGLGFDQGNFRGEDKTVYRVVHVMRQVNVSLIVVTGDQGTTDSIVDVLSLIFGELSGFTNGMALSDESAGGHWVVRLPKQIDIGSSEKNPRSDDPKDLLWTSTSSIMTDYEDSFIVPFIEPEYSIQGAAAPGNFPPHKFNIPNVVHVGRQSDAFIMNLRVGEDISVSDPSTLMIKPGNFNGHWILIGKKPGEVKLRLYTGGTSGNKPGGAVRPDFSHEMTIKVAY